MYLLLGRFFPLKSWHCYAGGYFLAQANKVKPYCGLSDIVVSEYDLGSYFNVTLWDSPFFYCQSSTNSKSNHLEM